MIYSAELNFSLQCEWYAFKVTHYSAQETKMPLNPFKIILGQQHKPLKTSKSGTEEHPIHHIDPSQIHHTHRISQQVKPPSTSTTQSAEEYIATKRTSLAELEKDMLLNQSEIRSRANSTKSATDHIRTKHLLKDLHNSIKKSDTGITNIKEEVQYKNF